MNTNGSHVLVVDGDVATRDHLCRYLGDNEFLVTAVDTGRHALEVLARDTIDLLVLEPELGDGDGLKLTQTLRDSSSMPIVVVSRRSEEADRVMGLELGADDYVTKPFSSRELLARIRAVLRRRTFESGRTAVDRNVRAYRFEGWELNLRRLILKAPDGAPVTLSRGDLGLLRAFLSAPRQVLSRDRLLDLTHVNGADVYDRSIDVRVARLRRRIEPDHSHPRFIRTERGVGYYFDATVTVVR